MASKIERFFGKMIAFLIQYTVGLVLPWWLIDAINNIVIDGYLSKFSNFKKINRYTFGLILPWWTLLIFEGNKQSKIEGSDTNSLSTPSSKKESKKLKYKCVGCGLTMEYYPSGGNANYPKDNHPYFNSICPNPKTSGSVYRDRKYHQWMRDYKN